MSVSCPLLIQDPMSDAIGGIVALGLGVKEWSVDECREKFIYFCKCVFSRKTTFGTFLSAITGGWSHSVHQVSKIYQKGGLYSSDVLDPIFKESYGEEEPLMQHRRVRVAVTTTGETRPFCQLLTTYNKSDHEIEPAYSWPQQHRHISSWKIWNA